MARQHGRKQAEERERWEEYAGRRDVLDYPPAFGGAVDGALRRVRESVTGDSDWGRDRPEPLWYRNLRTAGEWVVHLRIVYSEDLMLRRGPAYAAQRLDAIEALRRKDRLFIHNIGRADTEEEVRGLIGGESSRLAKLLEGLGEHGEVSPVPPPNWRQGDPLRGRVRGPDVQERAPRATKPKPPKPTKEQKAAARAEERLLRVLVALSRATDGLSANGLRQKVRMGKVELPDALKLGIGRKVIIKQETLEGPRYYAAPPPARKTAHEKPA